MELNKQVKMENSIYDKWLQELQTAVDLVDHDFDQPLERIRQSLPLISKVIGEVRSYVLKQGFTGDEQEIHFFKKIKPQMLALQLYEVLYYNLSMQRPISSPEMIKAYHEGELLQVFREFRINAFHYEYYRTKATELDHLYFLRNARPTDIRVFELIDPPPGFSTAMDYTFAKFMAYEKLRDYLLDQLSNSQTFLKIEKSANGGKIQLKWTGDAINLVELAYGIWLTGQLNNGNAGIAEIVQWLEIKFQINIGRPFRRWQAISGRKRVSQVKYLDQMREAILKRLDDENS